MVSCDWEFKEVYGMFKICNIYGLINREEREEIIEYILRDDILIF